jgi:pSer/pThr/pTyr-binding forkhead associated (FHA) protein
MSKIVTFGRGENNDVTVNDEKVSRTHLQILHDDNGNFTLVDLNSTNGTFVNGQRIKGEVRLQLNDRIRIGSTDLNWQEYFLQQQASILPEAKPVVFKPKTSETGRKKRYIAVAAVLCVAIAGVILYLALSNTIRTEQTEILTDEVKTAKDSISNLSTTLDNTVSKAKQDLEKAQKERLDKENELKGLLEQQKTASKGEKEKLETEVAAKRAELAKLQQNEQETSQKLKDTEAKLEQEAAARKKAEDDKLAAEKEAQKAKEQSASAENLKKEAERAAELTAEFYESISGLKDDEFKKIYEARFSQNVDKSKAKEALTAKFKSANNHGKQQIIDAVKKVRQAAGKKNDAEKTVQPEATQQPDTTKTNQ